MSRNKGEWKKMISRSLDKDFGVFLLNQLCSFQAGTFQKLKSKPNQCTFYRLNSSIVATDIL